FYEKFTACGDDWLRLYRGVSAGGYGLGNVLAGATGGIDGAAHPQDDADDGDEEHDGLWGRNHSYYTGDGNRRSDTVAHTGDNDNDVNNLPGPGYLSAHGSAFLGQGVRWTDVAGERE